MSTAAVVSPRALEPEVLLAPAALRWSLVAAYGALWAGGVVSYAFMGGPPDGTEWAAPAFLLCAGLVALSFTRARDWPWPLCAAGVGFASELLGANLGWPYGSYAYTPVLGPAVAGVPLVLGCAWLILAAQVQALLWRARVRGAARVVAGAVLLTAIDLVIDPLAAGPLGYWVWPEGGPYFGVPLSNFAGWLGVSAVIFALTPAGWRPGAAHLWLGASVVAFFGLIAAACGLWVVAAIACALPAAQALATQGFRRA